MSKTYWYHPESESLLVIDGEVDDFTAAECLEISEEQYLQLKEKFEGEIK